MGHTYAAHLSPAYESFSGLLLASMAAPVLFDTVPT